MKTARTGWVVVGAALLLLATLPRPAQAAGPPGETRMIDVRIEAVGPGWETAHWQEMSAGFDRDLGHLVALWVERLAGEAKRRVPVDEGVLRASITSAVYQVAGHLVGIVGTNEQHAPYVEFGTGLFSEYPGAPHKRIEAKSGHMLKIPVGRWKSLAAVDNPDVQAADSVGEHAVEGFVFRRSIAGMHPHEFLTPLLAEYGPQIEADIGQLAARYGFR